MDDGYGNTFIVEEGEYPITLLDSMDDTELYEYLIENTPTTDIDMYTIGNPSGYGNMMDEYRIFTSENELVRVI